MAARGSKLEKIVRRSLEVTWPIVRTIGAAMGKGIAGTTTYLGKQFVQHQGVIGALTYTSSTAAIGAALVDDYTFSGFVESAVLTGAAVGSMKGLEFILNQAEAASILPEKAGKRYAVTSGIIAATLAGLGTLYALNMTDAEGFVENIKEAGKAVYLTTLLYAGFETATYGYQKIKQAWQQGSKALKHTARAGVLSAALLAGLTTTNVVDMRDYDPTVYGAEEEKRAIDSAKLDENLKIKKDIFGEYASITLKEGESLYSAVVLQYTDFLDHDDVMRAAQRIQRRSFAVNDKDDRKAHGFRIVGLDVTNLHHGDEIKIPLNMLADRYRSGETTPKERIKPTNNVGSLKDIYVLLDAGHGGNDPGSSGNGVIEDEVAYDIMVRIKKILEEQYGATVYPFIEDKTTQFAPQTTLRKGNNEVILTNPEYHTGDIKTAVNLRAYKANYLYHQLTRSGVPENNIVFLSVHTDALDTHAQGMMIYYADAALRKDLRKSGRYLDYREVSDNPVINVEDDKAGSEAASYALAEKIVQNADKKKVVVHTPGTIRGKIHRRNKTYVPAVINHNPVPAKLLLEAGNCKNKEDAKRLLDQDYRQRVAETFVDGLKTYYNIH